MQSRLPGTIAGAPADAVARPAGALPPAQRVSHGRNALWWVLLLALAGGVYYTEVVLIEKDEKVILPTGNEREAFLAITFGKIAERGPDAIPAESFREQLRALRGAGYTAIGLDSLDAFYNGGRPLPDRPIVLLFDNVQRDSIEIADEALAETKFRAIAFADVGALSSGNIDLVSLHRLEQLADSGRWDIGVSACPSPAAPKPEDSPNATIIAFKNARELVEKWIDRPVRAINCERALIREESGEFREALTKGGYSFGVVLASPRLNYVDDSPMELRRVRVAKEWTADDLVASLASRMPRRSRFVDTFDQPVPKADWIADRADLAIADGALRVTAREGAAGGVVQLGGTDRWSDGEATVTVAERPDGQFWMSLRSGSGGAVRVGFADGRAAIQKTEGGTTHGYGSREISGKQFVLGLKVIGGRATASVDGQMIGDRPVEMPKGADRGALTLSVWDEDGKASVRIKRVEATPLPARAAIVAAVPGAGVWDELRRQVDELATISPRYYTWKEGRGSQTGGGDAALSIFASHHRLHLLPAVDVQLDASRPDVAAFNSQILRWAREPGIDGLNLVVSRDLATNAGWRKLVNDLRGQLRDENRQLAVTVTEQRGELPAGLRGFGNIYAMQGGPSAAFEIAVAPMSLVGVPAG